MSLYPIWKVDPFLKSISILPCIAHLHFTWLKSSWISHLLSSKVCVLSLSSFDHAYSLQNVLVFIYEIISYFLMGLALDAGRFFSYFITMFFIIMTMNGFFRQIGAITSNFFVAGQASNILYILVVMNSGYFIPKATMHPWFSWYVYGS